MNQNIENHLWVEKYRPKKLQDIIISEEYMKVFRECISKNQISNYLFVGPPGSGKSTLARIITSKSGVISRHDNVLEINGSSKSCRGIDFVDKIIEPFLKIPPIKNDKYRIVYIDECDFLTDQSFHSQRAIIEKYSEYGRFIYTANYISKIPEAIQSRFQIFTFKELPFNFVQDYVIKILHNEGITFKKKELDYIIHNLYPDIRRIINVLQRSVSNNKLVLNKDITLTTENKIYNLFLNINESFKEKNMSELSGVVDEIIKLIQNYDLEFRSLYTKIFESDKILVPIKVIINKYANNHGSCLVPQMHFMSMIFESIKCLKSLYYK